MNVREIQGDVTVHVYQGSRPEGSPPEAQAEGSAPEPSYSDDETRALSQALEDAYHRHEELASAGEDTAAVQEQILDLRRRLREGGQLQAGDFLKDGRFRLLEPLGQGGFSTVWKVYDREQRGLVPARWRSFSTRAS